MSYHMTAPAGLGQTSEQNVRALAEADCLGVDAATLLSACVFQPDAPGCGAFSDAGFLRDLWEVPLCADLAAVPVNCGDLPPNFAEIVRTCRKDPSSSPVCAAYGHPEVLRVTAESCPSARPVYEEVIGEEGSQRMMLWGAIGLAAVAAVGAVVFFGKKRR